MLTAAFFFAVLPLTVMAQDVMVDRIGLTIEMPADGMDLYGGEALALTAANTA